jgi:hypothetical protein
LDQEFRDVAGTVLISQCFLFAVSEEAPMKFNTTSYLAGVGSVVVVLSTGFAGGYFLATPRRIDPPNRLQRLAAEDHATAPATTTAKPEVKPEAVAAATPAPAETPAAPATAVVTPATAAPPAAQQPAIQQAAAQPQPTAPTNAPPAEAKAPEPARIAAAPEPNAPVKADKPDADKITAEKASADNKARAAEAKQAERKQRSDARRIAEQQRKQQELDIATVAVKRIIHSRDAGRDAPDIVRDRDEPIIVENDPQEAPAAEMPHFNLFGQ